MDGEELDEKRRAEVVAAIMEQRRVREGTACDRPVSSYILGGYYLVTPAFAVVEWVFGLHLRVPAIVVESDQRYIYYGICFLFGVLFFVLPRLAAWIAVVESTVNVMLVVVGFAKAIQGVLTAAVDDPLGFDPSLPAIASESMIGGVTALVIWVFALKCATIAAARELSESRAEEQAPRR